MAVYYRDTNFADFDPEDKITGTLYYDYTNSLYLWFSVDDDKWTISSTRGYRYTLDSSGLTTTFYDYHGKRYYYFNTSPYYYIWYDTDNTRWVISSTLGAETQATDSYWILSGASVIGTYTAQGVATGTKTIAKEINGWQNTVTGSANMAGEYTAVGSSTGTKYVGRKQLSANTTEDYYLKQDDQYNGEDTYKNLDGSRYLWFMERTPEADSWVITGNAPGVDVWGSLTGSIWIKGGSTMLGTYTYTWYGSGVDPALGDITIAEDGYLIDPTRETVAIRLAQTGVFL